MPHLHTQNNGLIIRVRHSNRSAQLPVECMMYSTGLAPRFRTNNSANGTRAAINTAYLRGSVEFFKVHTDIQACHLARIAIK